MGHSATKAPWSTSLPSHLSATKGHLPMDHIVSVPLDAATLKQLDDLRRAHPNVPSRKQIIERLIWEAHAEIVEKAQELKISA